MLLQADTHHSKAMQISFPWDQVILACVEHTLNTMSPDLMVGLVVRGDHLQALASNFHPPFTWRKAVAETDLAKAAQQYRKGQEERAEDLGGSKRRRRSDSVVLQEPAKSRLRLSLGVAGSRGGVRDDHYQQQQQLVREGSVLLSSLAAEAAQSKR